MEQCGKASQFGDSSVLGASREQLAVAPSLPSQEEWEQLLHGPCLAWGDPSLWKAREPFSAAPLLLVPQRR